MADFKTGILTVDLQALSFGGRGWKSLLKLGVHSFNICGSFENLLGFPVCVTVFKFLDAE